MSRSRANYLLAKDFVVCPPVPCVENNDIRIYPLLCTPTHMIHPKNIRHIGGGILWRTSLRHQKWIPIILHGAIVVLKPASQIQQLTLINTSLYLDFPSSSNSNILHFKLISKAIKWKTYFFGELNLWILHLKIASKQHSSTNYPRSLFKNEFLIGKSLFNVILRYSTKS